MFGMLLKICVEATKFLWSNVVLYLLLRPVFVISFNNMIPLSEKLLYKMFQPPEL